MSAAYSDRNLLFGVLALQMDFIDRDALVAALHSWVLDKNRSLGEILVAQQILNPDERDVLDALVQKHLDRHRGDAEKSLAAVAVSMPLREELRSLADSDVQASIAHLTTPPEPGEAGPLPVTVDEVKRIAGLRYQILRPHDKGGIGEVFVALDQELNRQVALKEIQERHSDDAHSRGRFVREAEITGGLEHPGIVPVYGLGQYADGRPFYAMRFIQGETLKDAIARYHRSGEDGARSPEFELRTLLTRFVAVCNAIAYAHSRGVIHRDLKTSNIMLGKYGETLVVDWGMAKAGMNEPARSMSEGLPEPYLVPSLADAIETQAGAAMGTPAYMSPEQASGRIDLLGAASDIYSLGATLYTLLTGRPPIEGKNTAEALRKAQRGEWLPVRQMKSEAPPALAAICHKAMAASPSARYATALELAADIERWLADEPVLAYRESWKARSRRWMRRHRTLVSTAGVALVIALVSATVGLVLVSGAWDRETAARKMAEANEKEARKQKVEARYNQYVSAMNLVQREYEEGKLDHVRELLAVQVPQEPDATDFRGFEWHYWQRLSHRELLILQGHKYWNSIDSHSSVLSAAFSPDSRRIASSSSENSVRVWDAVDGRELLCLKGHTGLVWGVAFSPDGQKLASASDDMTVRVWDAMNGREVLCLKGDRIFWGVLFSPDGRRIASWGHVNEKLWVWDAATGREIFTLQGKARLGKGVDFSPDGRRFTTRSRDNNVRVWDADSGQELLCLKGHTGEIQSTIFSPDGRRLASTGLDDTLRLWDAIGGLELLAIKSRFPVFAFSPDSRRLVSWEQDGVLRVLDAASGQVLLSFKRDIRSEPLIYGRDVIYSPNGRRLATWDGAGAIQVYDAADGRELLSFKGHEGTLMRVSFSPDGQRLASTGRDGTVRVWDVTGGPEPLILNGGPHLRGSESKSVAFSPDGRRLAAPVRNKKVRVWDAASGQELLTLNGHTEHVSAVAFSPAGRRLASAGRDQTVRVWDGANGKELLILKGHKGGISRLAYSPDGQRLASAGEDGTVRIWDAIRGQELLTFERGVKGGGVKGVAFSPNGRWLAATSSGEKLRTYTVRIWDAVSGQELLVLPTGPVYGISFSPDGRRLATAQWDKTVRVWSVSSGQELLLLKGHTGSVLDVAFSPDGRRLASADARRMVRVWDAEGGQELLTLKGRSGGVVSVAFSPDGERLASVGSNGKVLVWEAWPVSAETSHRRALVSDVEGLFFDLLLREKAIDALRKDSTLNEADQEFALTCAQTHSEDAWDWNENAWGMVKLRKVGKDVYARALRYAEAAVHLTPKNGHNLNTLGVAQYRVGRYADALTTLTKSEKLNTTKEGSHPADLAFLAMTQHRLGKKDEARATLDRLRKVMKQPRWANDAESVSFLQEAEELIEGKKASGN